MAQSEHPSSGPPRTHRFGRLLAALGAGFAGGLMAPVFYPALVRQARPATKRVIKAGIAAYERGRVAAAELAEQASDLMAEARAEYGEAQANPSSEDKSETASDVVALRGTGREATNS